jgi:hypothetical protein
MKRIIILFPAVLVLIVGTGTCTDLEAQQPVDDRSRELDLKLQLLDTKLDLLDSKLHLWETRPDELDCIERILLGDVEREDSEKWQRR